MSSWWNHILPLHQDGGNMNLYGSMGKIYGYMIGVSIISYSDNYRRSV